MLADVTARVINRDVFSRIVATSDSTRLKVLDIDLIMLAVDVLVTLKDLIRDLTIDAIELEV